MSLKTQAKILFKVLRIKMCLLLTVLYAVVYGLLFGLISGDGLKAVALQTLMWLLSYGYIFFGIGFGAGILSIFYTMISFHQDRKSAFKLWSGTIGLILLFGAIVNLAVVFVAKTIFQGTESVRIFGIDLTKGLLLNLGGMGALIAGILLIMGCGLLFMLLLAFFCVVGARFGWQITVGAILLFVSFALVSFVAHINILFTTGYYLYHYLAGVYGLAVLLVAAIYILSQKLEVKN